MYDKNSRNVKKTPMFNDFGLFKSDVLKRQSKNVPWLYLFIWFSSHMIDFNGDSLCAYRKSLLIKVDQEVYTGISVSTLLINI